MSHLLMPRAIEKCPRLSKSRGGWGLRVRTSASCLDLKFHASFFSHLSAICTCAPNSASKKQIWILTQITKRQEIKKKHGASADNDNDCDTGTDDRHL